MRVLQISLDQSINAGSRNAQVQERMSEYARVLGSVYVLAPGSLFGKPVKFEDNVEIINAGGNRLAYLAFGIVKGFLAVHKHRINAITTQDSLLAGFVGYAISRVSGIPLIVQEHGDRVDNAYWLRERWINHYLNIVSKFILKRSSAVRVVGKRVAGRIGALIGMQKVFLLPIYTDGVSAMSGKGQIRLPKNEGFILYVGRFAKEKNPLLFVKAANCLKDKFPKLIFVMVGDGELLGPAKKLAAGLGLADRFVFTGRLGKDELSSYYRQCEFLVITSNYEGYGLVAVEAMANSKPVVMTDVGCAGDLVINARNGYVVPVGNEEKLCSAMVELLSDKNAQKEFGAESKRIFSTLDDKEQSLQKMKDMYESVVNRHNANK